jgi:2-haloacid dehalogenase
MSKFVPDPKFITFDCYGTLVQWHRALLTAVRAVLAEHIEASGAGQDQVTDTVEALRTLSMDQQRRSPHRDYKTILRSSLAEVMARKGLSPRRDDGFACAPLNR